MCNDKCCNNCCHEDDLLCCEPLKHCCGGYSEHNNCCPHDKCCGCHGHVECCKDGCKKCNCICPCIKKEINDTKDELEKNINALESRVVRDEDKHDQDIINISNELVEIVENEKKDIVDLNKRIDKEIADRIDDVDEEEARAKAAEANLDNKINKETADRKEEAVKDAKYVNESGNAYIKFLNGNGKEICRVDANPFIKDGMIDNVSLIEYQGNKALRFIFNTDSGKTPITIDIGDLFENNDYYDKTQIDARVNTINNLILQEITRATGVENGIKGRVDAIENSYVKNVEYNSTTGYVTKTINGSTTNVVKIPTVPTNVSAFTNDAGYLTQHQDISGKVNRSELSAVATSGSYNDLINKPTITIDGNVYSLEQAISNLNTQIQTLKGQILWEVSSTDNNKIVAKDSKQAVAAGFFDSTVS